MKKRREGMRQDSDLFPPHYHSPTENGRKDFLFLKLSIFQKKMLWIEDVWSGPLFGVPMQSSQIGQGHGSLQKTA